MHFGVGTNVILNKIKGVAVLFTGAAILFFACENDIEKIKVVSSQEDLPVVEIVDLKSMSTDSGKISYTLKAPQVLRFERDGKEYTEFPKGMKIERFDKYGQMVSSISSDYAKQEVLEDKWEASNNVVATNIKGDTLKTEHLIWDHEKGIIYNDEYVTIISSDRIMQGDGFTSDEQMEVWRIKRPKGKIYVTIESEKSGKVDTATVGEPDTTKELPANGVLQFEQ